MTVRYGPYLGTDHASYPADFDAPRGTLTFLPGGTAKTLSLTVKGDALDEVDELALFIFTDPVNATVGGFGVGGVPIVDDD